MNLYRVYFANGWSSAQFADTIPEAEREAIVSYGVWFEDEAVIEKVILLLSEYP